MKSRRVAELRTITSADPSFEGSDHLGKAAADFFLRGGIKVDVVADVRFEVAGVHAGGVRQLLGQGEQYLIHGGFVRKRRFITHLADGAGDEGQGGLVEISAQAFDEASELGCMNRASLWFGVGFSLQPQHPTQSRLQRRGGLHGEFGPAQSIVIEHRAFLPEADRGAADGAGNQANDGLGVLGGDAFGEC